MPMRLAGMRSQVALASSKGRRGALLEKAHVADASLQQAFDAAARWV